MVALLSTKAEYVSLTLIRKEIIWMSLLLIQIGLLDKEGQYTEIKILKESKKLEQIKYNTATQVGKTSRTLTNTTSAAFLNASLPLTQALTPMSLKSNN